MRITDVNFANDVAMKAETREGLQNMTTKLEPGAGKVGLRKNGNKTKVIQIGITPKSTLVKVGHQSIAQVQQFSYLGSTLL